MEFLRFVSHHLPVYFHRVETAFLKWNIPANGHLFAILVSITWLHQQLVIWWDSESLELFIFSPPYGVPILNSQHASSYPTKISNFNCTGRITLGPNPPEPLSVHLGYCLYTSDIPSDCRNHKRDVAIVCLEPMESETFDVIPTVTFAPVTCEFLIYLWLLSFRLETSELNKDQMIK